MSIIIRVDDHDVRELLTRLQRKTGDLLPAMREIGLRYERRVLENFSREQAPDGTPWARLSSTTMMLGLGRNKGFGKRGLVKRGRRYLQNKKILFESGRLRQRVHNQPDKTSVRIGVTGVDYAAIHQFGGNAGRGRKVRIPARPYLALNQGNRLVLAERDKQMVMDVLQKHLTVD